ncbi:MAG: ComF family protein [Clostridiales bacterium]|nr:ComF family protein [Clostridiales bacterium]
MSIKSVLINIIYPQGIKCAVCGKDLFEENRYGICSGCLLKANIRFCPKCGRAIGETTNYCEDCTRYGREFTEARAPFIYEGKAKKLVYRLKYGGEKYLARFMAQYLADEYYKRLWHIDFITYVPTHTKREKTRGYNQAQLIANSLGEIINKPVVNALTRTKYSKNFAKLGRKERFKEAEESFAPNDKYKKKSILLIDDVFTTGATSGACAKALKSSGAGDVYVLTFCTSVCKND